ncbi:hypothetical protein AZE42_09752 [Rhizopogon vesiculosus]|uniref:Uncharacterized protein n=1 Tax=Rhizopogon vesiculosus TaxID=180088 RepID=A0A1J8RDR5_9AGAM|nr:hypothetical protein AZE42_09752 [Rhizopogon vesiculosus]
MLTFDEESDIKRWSS